MDDRDKIAYLQELASSHFNDGNLAAAIAAWKQVVGVDPANDEARKGIALCQRKLEVQDDMRRHEASVADDGAAADSPFDMGETVVVAPDAGGFNPDATMMVGPGSSLPAKPRASDQDSDKTLVFGAAVLPAAPPAPPAARPPAAAPGGGFDADKTMVFGSGPPAPPVARPPAAAPGGGFDADKTMVFGSGPPAPPVARPPAAAPGGGFDADKTMVFGSAPPAPPPPPPAKAGGFDADSTVMFAPPPAKAPKPDDDMDKTVVFGGGNPPAAWGAPPAPPPAPRPAADSDSTVMSDGGWDLGPATPVPPPPAPPQAKAPPPPPPPPPRKAAPATGDLEDFVMPSGGLDLGGSPAAPQFGLPPAPPKPAPGPAAPPAFGFSFDLPPAAPAAPGLPDLPSVGLPPPAPKAKPVPPPPAAKAPPPPPPPGKGASSPASFGDIEPGEAAGLEVPTLGFAEEPEAPVSASGGDSAAHEEAMRERFAKEFGKTPVTPAADAPRPAAAPRKGRALPWLILLVVFGGLITGAWFAIKHFTPEAPPVVQAEKPKPPPVPEQLDPAEASRLMEEALREADAASQTGDLKSARAALARYDATAARASVQLAGHEATVQRVRTEQQYQDNLAVAIRTFCKEDYPSARRLFLDLEVAKPDDKTPGGYIERIYYNAGLQQLQQKAPTEAAWFFDQVLARSPADAQAQELKAYASRFKPGEELDYKYLSFVDRLEPRMAGCN